MTKNSIVEIDKIKYKTININLHNPLSEDEKEIFLSLNNIFHKTDLFVSVEKENAVLYLRTVDLEFLKEKVTKICESNNLNPKDNILVRTINHIESIKSYGLKGKKRLYVEYDKERKVKLRKHKEIKRGKYYYALTHNFSKKNNELPEEYKNKIICGDAEEILKKLPDNCIDLVFTSPPYNFGLEYENHQDELKWNDYFSKLFSIFEECIRILKYGGRIIINVQPLFSDYIPIHHIISNWFMGKKLIWKGEIVWDKHNYNCKYTAWGSWKSPSNPYLKYTWEFIEIFCKGTLKHFGKKELIDINGEEFKKWVYAKWDIPPESNMKKYGHPAMFPEQLVERILKLFSFKNDIILDPFNGAGTTTVVAKRLQRTYIGIDISEEYCKKAEERISKILNNKSLF